MDKKIKLLIYLSSHTDFNQRNIAEILGFSVGSINSLLKGLAADGSIKAYITSASGRMGYKLTPKGRNIIEKHTKSMYVERLLMEGSDDIKPPESAVILAAGICDSFDIPVGLLPVGESTVIDTMIASLKKIGVFRICIVTGSQSQMYKTHFSGTAVSLFTNDRYKWSGTMESLMCADSFIRGDFLLIDGNQILEDAAYNIMRNCKASNCMLITAPSDSGDEAYVQLDSSGNIFRISKDIKQLGHIDGELVGFSRVSYELYLRMREEYKSCDNPLISYEYVMENIGRIYKIDCIQAKNLIFNVIENADQYEYCKENLIRQIRRKETTDTKNAASVFAKVTGTNQKDIEEVIPCGGMTNANYLIRVKNTDSGDRKSENDISQTADDDSFILRIPGVATSNIIDRENESYINSIAAKAGLSPESVYFDTDSGIKVTRYIPGAQTLLSNSAKMEKNISKTTALMRRLHLTDIEKHPGIRTFDILSNYNSYKAIAEGKTFHPDFAENEKMFFEVLKELESLDVKKTLCHNDLVPENFVFDSVGRLYLIDWEYAGINDPMWDLASHLLESSFSEIEEELFCRHYFGRDASERELYRISLCKICQDFLWAMWTDAKETCGENFGSYGSDRYDRAVKAMNRLRAH